jgi:predicted permease
VSAAAGVLRDVRLAAKSLRRSPGFTLIAIVTLALGIGANTSMFSIFNGYVLQPPPYPDSGELERIYRATSRTPRGGVSPADYLELKAVMGGFGDIAAYADSNVSLSESGRAPEMAEGLRVSANLFSTLRSQPELGRGFRPEEEQFGNHRVLVISHRYWQDRFAGDPQIIGRAVRIDGEPYQIVGVLPAAFSDWRHLDSNDVYRPLGFDEKESRDRDATWVRVIGRRAPAVTHAQAEAFVDAFGRRLAREFPAADAEATWRSVPFAETFLPRNGRDILAMLVGLSAFVLLIACSNLANLVLARTMARSREFAVRAALGASRAQVVRPVFVECLLLAAAGGVAALFVAVWTFDWMAVRSAGDNGVGVVLSLDWRVLGFAFAACLFTAMAFGVVPALFVHRLDLNTALKSGGRGATAGRGHNRFRQALIVGQFALAMVLLAGAGMFVRGLDELNHRRYGWESDQLVTGTIVLPAPAYPDDAKVLAFQRAALERLEAVPGVTSASLSWAMPFFGLAEPRKLRVAGREVAPGREPSAHVNGISPGYFETVGTRLLEGRRFTAADTRTSPRVFIVNEAMVRGLFRGESAIGRRIAFAGGDPVEWGEVVGVAADVQSVRDQPSQIAYQIYQPLAQEPRRDAEIAVRAAGVDPAGLVAPVRAAMMSVDADLPVRKLQPAEATITRANYQLGVLASLLTGLAALGLALASLGVYGVVARTVAQRTGEFGIRLALGARAGDITRLVLTSGAKLAILGCALGVAGAIALAGLLASAFPAIETNSPAVVPAVALLLVAIAQAACYLPARKASRVSPTEALRAE